MKLLTALILLFALLYSPNLAAQQEFTKGWVMYLEGSQGILTNFHSSPDLYTGNLQLTPQVTVIPGVLRLAAATGLAFNNKKLTGLFGGGLNWKLATVHAQPFGSLLNLQLQAQHVWGTGKQRLVGGGLKAELGQIILAGITAHRDYTSGNWWLQAGIGFNLLHKQRGKPDDPFENQ